MKSLTPNRRQLLELLDGREATGSQLAAETGRWQPNVCRDLLALHRAGLLTRRREDGGIRVFYALAGDR